MKYKTFKKLKKLQEEFGVNGTLAGPVGKIVQKLLALSFHEIGFKIRNRDSQGADIDVKLESNEKFAVEVKTTEKSSVYISDDNFHALKLRIKDGYLPMIAVLHISHLENWIFAKIPIEEIQTGNVLIEKLRPYRIKELERRLSPFFDRVVSENFSDIMKRGDKYLIDKVKQIENSYEID